MLMTAFFHAPVSGQAPANPLTDYHEQFRMLKSVLSAKRSDLNHLQSMFNAGQIQSGVKQRQVFMKLRSIYVTVRSREKIWSGALRTVLNSTLDNGSHTQIASDQRYYIKIKAKFDAMYDRVYGELMSSETLI
ncbi:hypothetical protein K7432_012128 [Basidiobolus ranarum]|uniref:Uncharacterized protein n=1 Tax=Basidiobolus ranarum TaxID=34480 RepID=A0ABR2VSW2_9FUNG